MHLNACGFMHLYFIHVHLHMNVNSDNMFQNDYLMDIALQNILNMSQIVEQLSYKESLVKLLQIVIKMW